MRVAASQLNGHVAALLQLLNMLPIACTALNICNCALPMSSAGKHSATANQTASYLCAPAELKSDERLDRAAACLQRELPPLLAAAGLLLPLQLTVGGLGHFHHRVRSASCFLAAILATANCVVATNKSAWLRSLER